MKRVLALQHTWDDPSGYLGEILQEHGIACDTVDVEKEPLPVFNAYDAVIVLGGPQHAPADHCYPYLAEEKTAIREAVEQDIPLLGICLGGQLLALAMGAHVTRQDSTEIGFSTVQFTEDGKAEPLFQGLPGYEMAIQWHEDAFTIPPGGVLLATNSHTYNQAFRIGRRAYGLQYHIELTPEMLDTWLRFPEYKRRKLSRRRGLTPRIDRWERSACYPIFREHTRILFENFLRVGNLL